MFIVLTVPPYQNYFIITGKNLMATKRVFLMPPVFRPNTIIFNIFYFCFFQVAYLETDGLLALG